MENFFTAFTRNRWNTVVITAVTVELPSLPRNYRVITELDFSRKNDVEFQ